MIPNEATMHQSSKKGDVTTKGNCTAFNNEINAYRMVDCKKYEIIQLKKFTA